MKHFLLLIAISFLLFCEKSGDIAGSTTEVNTGSIAGSIVTDGSIFKDSVKVTLFEGSNTLSKRLDVTGEEKRKITVSDGYFFFDSLEGTYSIRVSKDSMVLGEELAIEVPKGKRVNVEINITIIIKQIFNIINIDNSTNVTVNNYYLNGGNGYIEHENGSFNLVFTKRDTVTITVDVETGGKSDTLEIVFIKQPNGSYKHQKIHTTLPIIIVNGGTIQMTGKGSDSTDLVIEGVIKEDAKLF